MRTDTRWVIAAALLLGCTLASSQEVATAAARVDAVFEPWNASSSPGCSVAIMRGGKIEYARGYGMADLDHGLSNSPTTVYHVASLSKQFAAAAIVLLAQDHRLGLDDEVRKYLPELPILDRRITLRQLVHHTSGLRDQWELLSLSGWRISQDLVTDEDVLSVLGRQRVLNFTPNSKYSYSNSGYTLLGQVVKRVSGKSLREFTAERIFRPLGMTDTHFRDDSREIVPGLAYGYTRENEAYKLSVTNFDTVGATGLLTTVEDMARWDENFYTGQVGGSSFLEQMQERGVLNDGSKIDYAFGLVHGTYRGVPVLDHTGSDAGYRAYFGRFPQQRLSIAVLCNYAKISPFKIAQKITDIYLGGHLESLPNQTPGGALLESAAANLAGVYVRLDGRMATHVVIRDGALGILNANDASVTPLRAQGDARFRVEGRADVIDFSGGLLTVSGPGQESQQFQRVAFVPPSKPQLASYAGNYASAEIALPYRVREKNGRLVVSQMKLRDHPLVPVGPDLFEARFGVLRFTRNAGRVDGFVINTNRVVDIRFDRVSED